VSFKNHRFLNNLRTALVGRSRWNLLLGALSLIILIGSFTALAYNTLNQKESERFTINGKEYEWDTLYDDFETMEVQGSEGVPLSLLIDDAGITDPSSHDYKIKGADGYFKTVSWRDMESGILTLEGKKVVFETKAKAYWVRDVVEIEVE
jgi:hypothetical protein